MAKSKAFTRKILTPVGTPSVPLEDIERAVRKVKQARREREQTKRARQRG